MSGMYRIICSRLLVLFQLAIVVSLVGYTIPNVSAAMHGSAFSSTQAVVAQQGHASGHSHGTASEHVASQSMQHADAGHPSGEDGSAGKSVQKDCCQDFCLSMAVPAGYETADGPVMSSIRTYIDDSKAIGQISFLNKPPSI